MEIYLDHIESFNHRINAIVSMRDKSPLLKEAQEKAIALARGDYQGRRWQGRCHANRSWNHAVSRGI
ncbi:hypothetical protein OI69_09525 [Pectobacterium fontis]|uniref:Uncharacterized protein n=2 Tax=Pectobacterium fontis TaxID=2558042 RepID=A0A7V8IIX6_9GAMM|nr:hypothetical protein OI69_09525 [Pectobacterium fontis]